MKNKLYSLILVVVLAFGCFALTACDNKPSGGNENSGSGKVAVQSVTLDKSALTLEVDQTATLTATVSPDNATDKTVKWESSNEAVATVQNGTVTAKSVGTATVTATADGKSAQCAVTVKAAELSEQDWTDAFTAFATSTNYTASMSIMEVVSTVIKFDGDKIYLLSGKNETIYSKDGEKYSLYSKVGDGEWTKTEIMKEVYDQYKNNFGQSASSISDMFKDKFLSFELKNGVYTAASLTMDDAVFNDIEVTFANKALSKIKFNQPESGEMPENTCVYDAIGSTEIILPEVQEPTEGIQYKVDGDHAVVLGLNTYNYPDDIMIADKYQNMPVTVIDSASFRDAKTLKSVKLPDSITTIGSSAFSGCRSLEKINLPNQLTTIDSSAFNNCEKLANIEFPQALETVGYNALENTAWLNAQPDGVVYAGKVLYKYKGTAASGTDVTIKNDTVSITPYAFYQCEWLQTITIPGSVKVVGNRAFQDCLYLDNVIVSEGVEVIDYYAFMDCKLTTITLPVSLNTLGEYVFSGTSLTTINYNGTSAQWELIKKEGWNKNTGHDAGTVNPSINYNGDNA